MTVSHRGVVATLATWFFFAALLLCGGAIAEGEKPAASDDYERGPHRGRMLREGDFAIEVTIFETGVPPQFRLYAYEKDKPIDPAQVQVTVELTRLGGQVDRFTFKAEGDHLTGSARVIEPHSFDVKVSASYGGKSHQWSYDSYEGRTRIEPAVAEAAGIKTELTGPATIRDELHLMGVVAIDENRQARVRARFPGLVREVRAGLGDTVTAGQALATVESNESLRAYTVTSPIAGVVTARSTNAGDVAGDSVLFEITDLTQVWVDLHAFGTGASKLQPGQPVTIRSSFGELEAEATLDRVLPIAAAGSQSVTARVRLPNDGRWRPGLAVSADVVVGTRDVPLAVKVAGLQRFRDFTVVFTQVGGTYEVRMLELGARDGESVEVLEGIAPGIPYVTEQSFLIKADIDKSGASHDH
ncbi:cobalt-zinc-cadmium efflux system membrane fusion protein [Tahibacter aquaticus]|uniref:Cobalt-zinc-cadmium efflux system membrane fusion protein n=1 Tax=Tahibacter aquaticus TaxID=520092 RepID=A0A4R6Z1Y5_9GAMM|nr:efflux RND transporter periplasmic adaptor subunit [Tahibacter aquaticus]TDR45580.1 cobalt-zinc-cadmium efflux system membrane fusion protein [Tahibacter aquaticus]